MIEEQIESTDLFCLLSDIRDAVGDKKGKLTQDQLVKRCRLLRAVVEEARGISCLYDPVIDRIVINKGKLLELWNAMKDLERHETLSDQFLAGDLGFKA